MKFKSELWEMISKYPPRLLNRSSRTAVSKDQRVSWPIMQMSYLVNDCKYYENLPTKNWFARKASFARSRVCQWGQNYMLHAAWYLARLYEISYVKGVKRNKNSHNMVDLRHLSLMSKESKVHSIYNVDFNSKEFELGQNLN